MAYIGMFKTSKKKVVGDTVGSIRADIRRRFPDVANINFSVRYFDADVDEYLDFDNERLPPSGATLRVEYDIFASETESAADSEATIFSPPPVPESFAFMR